MSEQQYRWLPAENLYPDQGKKSYRMKRFRYRLRSFLHQRLITQFEQFINQSPELVDLLNTRVNFAYPLVHRFLDKRFSAQQRFELMKENLLFLPQKLAHLNRSFLWQSPINLGEIIEGFDLILNVNEHQAMEGFWALELWEKEQNRLIYLLTFAKLDNALLIAVIQGPNYQDSKDIVKILTKKCHGLRPAYLMVDAMKLLTQILGFEKLLGIPQRNQNKSRLVQSKRYVVDYDVIFSESGGFLNNYWELPLLIETKNLEQVESKKRSMYRKRYTMLEQLFVKMKNQLIPQK
ncbi:MAG: DUF535 family protein [Lonepinella koalarum]|nr:DUF535 family protein [Lonepinella koalarum]